MDLIIFCHLETIKRNNFQYAKILRLTSFKSIFKYILKALFRNKLYTILL